MARQHPRVNLKGPPAVSALDRPSGGLTADSHAAAARPGAVIGYCCENLLPQPDFLGAHVATSVDWESGIMNYRDAVPACITENSREAPDRARK